MSEAPRALAIAGLVLKSAEPRALADFYARALGFEIAARTASEVRLHLGDTRLSIERATGRPYPADVAGPSSLFQHFALATADIAASYARLCAASRSAGVSPAKSFAREPRRAKEGRRAAGPPDGGFGWTEISRGGPVRLPASSGGVTAFKFRDPEGHPLELIEFVGKAEPPRIDHSAISVADVERSLAWYATLGLAAGDRSLNQGSEQADLDGLEAPIVEVAALAPPRPPPHLELLAYRAPPPRADPPPALDDIAATRIIVAPARQAPLPPFGGAPPTPSGREAPLLPLWGKGTAEGGGGGPTFQDPDGHWLEWEVSPGAR